MGLRKKGYDGQIASGLQRLRIVDTQSVRVERPSNSDTGSNSGDRDRCLERGHSVEE